MKHNLHCPTLIASGAICTCGAWKRAVADQLLAADNALSTKADAINPGHYRGHPSGVECIQITEHMNFNLGNAVKYIWRADEKGDPVENLKKARWYIDREIALRELVK